MMTGKPRATFTENCLQNTGMSSETAAITNDLLSIGTIGTANRYAWNLAYKGYQIASQSAMRLFQVQAPSRFDVIVVEHEFIPVSQRYARKNLENGFCGRKGFQLKNFNPEIGRNHSTVLDGRSYGGHALDQMQNRGFTPSVIEETIQSGMDNMNKTSGRIQFYDPVNNISVVTEDGKVVTATYGRP